MPNFFYQSYKEKLTKGLFYLLKYSDVEEVLSPLSVEDICLYVRHGIHQAFRKEDRDRLAAEGKFRIFRCSNYKPKIRRSIYSLLPDSCPEKKNIYGMNAYIYALPHTLTEELVLTRKIVKDLLVAELTKHMKEAQFQQQWSIDLTLMSKSKMLRCETAYNFKRKIREIELKTISDE